MDSIPMASIQGKSDFVNHTASLGSDISHVLQSYESLRFEGDGGPARTLKQLNGCVQNLQQVRDLIVQAHQDGPGKDICLLISGHGLEYALSLAEECAVAFDATVTALTKGDNVGLSARNWPSPVFEENGVKAIRRRELDQDKIFHQLKTCSKYTIRCDLGPVTKRLNELQISLLLFVQVVTVKKIATKLSLSDTAVPNLVEYYGRIRRAARILGLSSPKGKILSSQKPVTYYDGSSSSNSSETDESEDDASTRPPRPHANQTGPTPQPGLPTGSGVEEDEPPVEIHPPSYAENGLPNPVPSEKGERTANNLGSDEEDDQKENIKDTKIEVNKDGMAQINSFDDARLFSCQSHGFMMKFKNMFRSKASLEAEMKQTLEGSNSSLVAYVINNFEYRKIPHSAFHSLEYTHMRTILSQLNDNSWFKTFSDLTNCEHDTLEAIVGRQLEGSHMVSRELVALKVLRKNRVNAWMRLVQHGLRAGNCFPQFDNYRILLAIVRQKKDAGVKMHFSVPRTIPKFHEEDSLPRPQLPRSSFDDNAQRLFDLSEPSGPFNGRRPVMHSLPHPPPPPPPGWRPMGAPRSAPKPPRNIPATPAINLEGKTLSKPAVLMALTTYTAYTIRQAPPRNLDLGPGALFHTNEAPWIRSLVTREVSSASDMKRRVSEFASMGNSVIEMKFQLNDLQNNHLTFLFNDLNGDETDQNFEYELVELSLINRDLGLLIQQPDSPVDIIHVIVRRAPKEGTDVVELYKSLITNPPAPIFRPGPPGPPRPPGPPHIVYAGRRGRRRRPRHRASVSSFNSSTDTASSSYFSSDDGSDSDSEAEAAKKIKRWGKDEDPIKLKFEKSLKGQDIVQCLLDMWTVSPRDEKEDK